MLTLVTVLLSLVVSLEIGTQQTETHPTLSWQSCSSGGSCSSKSGSIVLDSNWRWVHDSGTTNCYDGNLWSTDLCPNTDTCTSKCYIEGADYSGTYGITTSGSKLTLKFVTKGSYSTNIGSRVYLLKDENTYETFKLKNNEFTFTVDDSQLDCGLNGALYFVAMDADGGKAKYSAFKPGAKYGMGYCDAQCPHDMKFISGKANVDGWKPQDNDENSGDGNLGTCCSEMDIWEGNKISQAYTVHACTKSGQYECSGNACGDDNNRYGGTCDKDGCDFASYRWGARDFYGPGLTVNSNQPVTVVTQFIGDPLTEIKRFYVQGGKVINNSKTSNLASTYDSITDAFCDATKAASGDTNDFKAKGSMSGFSQRLDAGQVLVLSLWDDHTANMLWLDSTYPTDSRDDTAKRGTCATSSGVPKDVESQQANAQVVFSDIKFGPINSTFKFN